MEKTFGIKEKFIHALYLLVFFPIGTYFGAHWFMASSISEHALDYDRMARVV